MAQPFNTTWTGTIFELDDPRSTHEEDNKSDAQLEYALEEYFTNNLSGISVLEGGGTLPPIWDEVEEELISRGCIAVVEYLGEKFLATVTVPADSLNGHNLLRRFDKVRLTLLSNDRIVLDSTKQKTKNSTGKEIEDPRGYPYKYAVFQNNRDCIGYLHRIRYYIKHMVLCVKKMRWDLFMSQKRLITILKEQPDQEDVNYFLSGWRKKQLVIMSVQRSRKPSKEARAQGKEGISVHEVNFTVYEPKTDERAKIIRDFNWWLALAEKLVGIRSDILAGKEERANNPEVMAAQSGFDAFEKKGSKWRVKGIKDYIFVFNEPTANLNLKYGKIETKI